jgi:hypothetical protein
MDKHKSTTAMSQEGAELFRLALSFVEPDHNTQLKLSVISEGIARDLLRAYAITCGIPLPIFEQLPAHTKAKFRTQAEREVRLVDDLVLRDAVEDGIRDTLYWLDGTYYGAGDVPAPQDIARQAIYAFIAALNNPTPQEPR